MVEFSKTREELSRAKNVEKIVNQLFYNGSKDFESYMLIFDYMTRHIILVFHDEVEKNRESLKDKIKRKLEKSGKNDYSKGQITKKINDTIKRIEKIQTPLILAYTSFKNNRNKSVAHFLEPMTVSWNNITDVKLDEKNQKIFNIADVGEKIIPLIDKELRKIS